MLLSRLHISKNFSFKNQKKKEEIQIAKISGWMGEALSMVQLGRYVSVTRPFSIKPSILRIPNDTPRENQFRSFSETGVKVFFLLCGLSRGSVLFEFVSEFCKAFLLNFY